MQATFVHELDMEMHLYIDDYCWCLSFIGWVSPESAGMSWELANELTLDRWPAYTVWYLCHPCSNSNENSFWNTESGCKLIRVFQLTNGGTTLAWEMLSWELLRKMELLVCIEGWDQRWEELWLWIWACLLPMMRCPLSFTNTNSSLNSGFLTLSDPWWLCLEILNFYLAYIALQLQVFIASTKSTAHYCKSNHSQTIFSKASVAYCYRNMQMFLVERYGFPKSTVWLL